ncbi:hypothetical protein [Aquimarina sp. RZ0]|uniref:hypothetical protein n=1 Tax=Aquimarina sp. RZ0 TaxID=2607730 RepID=UPI0011F0B495|nr:hypothetical protein [Aquimarina sp. RZ0]KAA1245339.1 hypothetical protein F0000_12530 [Aquimarina sp. RZ0]
MKKHILLITCCVCIIFTIQAQNPSTLTIEKTDNTSGSLNFKNPTGFWHLSGPRSYELNNSFSVFWNDGSYKRYLTISDSGNVGVGTANPLEKFQINNSYTFHDGGHKVIGFLYSPSGGVDLDDSKFSAEIRFNPVNGNFRLGTANSLSTIPVTHLNIDKNGKIGIGTMDTKGFKLGVKGKIAAEEVKISLHSEWSDFVFYDNYKLPTLQEVESYIKEKGHLKDIPSEKEVEENGIFLGEMDARLLQKIEELTLYTIEQEKRIKELESLNDKLLELQSRMEKLESGK